MTLEQYAQDIYKYLASKVPTMEHCIAAEIAEFAAMKTHNYTMDSIAENNKVWAKECKRLNSEWERYIRRMRK